MTCFRGSCSHLTRYMESLQQMQYKKLKYNKIKQNMQLQLLHKCKRVVVLIILTEGGEGGKICRVSKLNFIPMGICKIHDQSANGFGF